MDGGYVEIVEKLLYESTVRPNLELRDVSGKTPLDLAETFDMINLMERLNYRSESMFSMNRSNRRRDSFYSQYSMNSPGVRNYDSASYKGFSPASKTCQGNKLFAQSMSSRPVSANSGFSNFLLREVRNKSTVDYKTHAERHPEALEDFVSKFSYSGVEEQPHEENMNTHRENQSQEELKVPKSRVERRGRSRDRTNSRGKKRAND